MEKYSKPVKNRTNIRVVRKIEPEIGPVYKPTVPFPYEQKRQAQFRSTVQNCWVCTGTRKCISLTKLVTLSQYIRETLFSYLWFLIFRNKLSKFNFGEPQNSFFFLILLPMFCSNFFNHKLSAFWRWSMNIVYCLEIFCIHFCVFGITKNYEYYLLDV